MQNIVSMHDNLHLIILFFYDIELSNIKSKYMCSKGSSIFICI